MHPWGHLAVAYLLYSLYSHGRYRRSPRPAPALAAAVGSQFADVIDKPLGWGLGLFPTGRAVGHSLLFAAILIGVVYASALALGRLEAATAFVIAHLSHSVTDLPPLFFLGYPAGAEYFLWPFVPIGTFGLGEQVFEPPGPVEPVFAPLTDPATYVAMELALLGLAVGLWHVDGRPGARYVRRLARYSRRWFDRAPE